MLQDVWQNYRVALQRWLPFVAAHLFVRLAIAALLVPAIGILLAATLYFSDQTALTDQDIAWFFLTPVGAIGAVAILSMVIVALVLDVVVATAIIRRAPQGILAAVRVAAAFTLHSVPRLAPFVARFLFRVLAISLPFLAVGAGVAALFLTDYDINYYLTEQPTEFILAVVLIGFIILLLALVLMTRLSSWAISLHLSVFDRVPAAQAFEQSRDLMHNHRAKLVGRVLWWIAIRSVFAALFASATALLFTWTLGWQSNNTDLLVAGVVACSLLYAAGSSVINAVSNGALADLLNDEFERALFGRVPADDVEEDVSGSPLLRRDSAVIAVVLVVSAVSIGGSSFLLEDMKGEAEATIIAHRGAAALAPENTMASVRRAIEDGADWIEIDVQEDADGEIIVVHDSDFMKSSNEPLKVWNATASDLSDLDIGSWFDPSYASERVPLLRDVLTEARGQSKVLIELKYYGHDVDLENRVASLVEETDMVGQIATMSLKYPAVQKMRKLRPDWETGVLAATSIGDLTGLEGDFLALNQARITALTVRNANDAGKLVYAWTVNDALSIARMLWIGVDGIITDDPALARTVLEEYNGLSIVERFLLAAGDQISGALVQEQIEELRP